MKILFIGDIYGKPGRHIIRSKLPLIIKNKNIDLAIANCENLASGRGVTKKTVRQVIDAGVEVFTSGNHLWDRKEGLDYLKKEKRIVKPLNIPGNTFGQEYYLYETDDNTKIAILTLAGQSFMGPADSPFFTLKKMLPKIRQITNNIIIDFHAESTAEKKSFGLFFDGKVSAILGTHTHVQTADETILPNGTAYITDAGMTGSQHSVIGVKKEIIFEKITTGMPKRYEPGKIDLKIKGVIVDLDLKSGKAIKIKRL